MSRLQQSDLTYLGAFKLPTGSFDVGGGLYTGFSYCQGPICFNPDGNGGAGSLLMVSHVYAQKVAEINIPEPINGSYASLHTASVLHNFVDPCEGHRGETNPGVGSIYLGGLHIYNGFLYLTSYTYYDGGVSASSSHFRRPVNLDDTGHVIGPVKVGNVNPGFVAGYMCDVPADHQQAIGKPALTGQCCLAIIGRSSLGPAAFGFDPEDIGSVNPVPINDLVQYPSSHATLGGWGDPGSNIYYNGTAKIKGLVFPAGFDSLIFAGSLGIGNWCYGSGTECGDTCISAKGNHAYPYRSQFWHYNVNDLLNAANPWDVVPDIWPITFPFGSCTAELGGIAYDVENRLIYVVQIYGNSTMPAIHVFQHKEVDMPKTLNVATQIDTVPGGTFTVRTQLLDTGNNVVGQASSAPVVVPADPPSTPIVEVPVVTVS